MSKQVFHPLALVVLFVVLPLVVVRPGTAVAQPRPRRANPIAHPSQAAAEAQRRGTSDRDASRSAEASAEGATLDPATNYPTRSFRLSFGFGAGVTGIVGLGPFCSLDVHLRIGGILSNDRSISWEMAVGFLYVPPPDANDEAAADSPIFLRVMQGPVYRRIRGRRYLDVGLFLDHVYMLPMGAGAVLGFGSRIGVGVLFPRKERRSGTTIGGDARLERLDGHATITLQVMMDRAF